MKYLRIYWPQIKLFAKTHKLLAGLIALTFVSGVYGTLHPKAATGATRYILGTVERGTIAVSVSGTGTVSASDQLDVKAKASGDVLSVKVKTGQMVAAGDLLAVIDPTDASNALQTAQISYQKLVEPADTATLIAARQAVVDAQTAAVKAYDNVFKDTGSAILSVQSALDGLKSMLESSSGYLSSQAVSGLDLTARTDRETAGAEYDTATRDLLFLENNYANVTRSSATSTLDSLLTDTLKTTTDLLQALRDTGVAVRYVETVTSNSGDSTTNKNALAQGAAAQASVASWLSDVNSQLSNLRTDQADALSAPNTIAEKQASLDKLVRGPDPLDVQSEQLSVAQKQKAYNDSFVVAPIAGQVGKLDVKAGDTASNGTIVATLISANKIATISLNEVDAAKVKVGDKATLTFDAVDGLNLTGTVTDLDLIGTVTQGVVNYTAKIAFDQDDPRVLAGMSVSASVITDVKTDVLSIPLSAVKTDNQGSYVYLPPTSSSTPPETAAIETGLSNDTNVEVVSGLSEGEQIVARTVSGTAAAPTTQAPSLFGGGGNRTTGGATRALGR